MWAIEEVLFVEDNADSMIKIEAPEVDEELCGSKETKYPSESNTDAKIDKVGEIFRISAHQMKFVCVHCAEEFTALGEFTLHIEQHLVHILEASIQPKAEVEEVNVSENRGPETELQEVAHNSDSDIEHQKSIDDKVRDSIRVDKKGKKTYVCPHCDRCFDRVYNMKRHLATHFADNKTFDCTICHQKFAQGGYLQKHMQNVHNKIVKMHKCDGCDVEFKLKGDLKRHQRTMHLVEKTKDEDDTETTYECYMCHEKIETKRLLSYHLRRRHWDTPYPCEVCGHEAKTQSALSRHLKIHSSNAAEFYKCKECPNTFELYRQLRYHQKLNHAATYKAQKEPPVLYCDICQKVFTLRSSLRQHKMIHEQNSRKYKCEICGWGFISRGNLKVHISIHAGERPCKCEICHKSFARGYMPEHMRTHTGEKRSLCTTCGMSFISNGRLKRHMVTHTKERNYKCNMCPKTYARSEKLLAHRRTHTGEFIYNCLECKRGFAERRSLKKHMLSHHGRPLDEPALTGGRKQPTNVSQRT